MGAGRTETFKIVAGVMKRDFFHGGDVILRDKPVRYRVPAPAVKAGVAYVAEDPQGRGLFRNDVNRAQCLSRSAREIPRRPRAAVQARAVSMPARIGSSASMCARLVMKLR